MISLLPQLEQLTLCRDVERLDEMFVDTLLGLFLPAHVALARCVGDAGDERWLVTAQRDLQDSGPATQPVACSISLKSLPHLHDCPSRQRCAQTHQPVIEMGEGDEVTVCLPLFNPGAQAAVVELLFKDKPRAAEIDMLEYVVRVMANHYALLEYAQHDTLTGLLNRKTFDESFLKASMPAHGPSASGGPDLRRDKAELGHWLAIIDIDHFKSINDRFGHLIGDEVLLLLARIMRRTFRFQDRLYRFGGEEFLVLLRCDSDADAHAACHRLLDNVQSQAFPRVGQVTVSIGFTEVEPGVSPSLAFARADQAVYFAKQNGRNRVCSFSALVREGELKDSTESGEVELF